MIDQTRPVLVRAHDSDPTQVYLDTPPELAPTMGLFQPARYIGKRGASYVLPLTELPTFRRFCQLQGVDLTDQRGATATDRPYGRERPLPECAYCAQPVQRGTSFRYCPGCGREWTPIEVQPYRQEALVTTCPACGGEQSAGLDWCGRCGAPLPKDTHTQPLTPRTHLAEPVTLAHTIDEYIRDHVDPKEG